MNSQKIRECRICGSKELANILDLGVQPLANDLRENKSVSQISFPLIICRCKVCSLIQLTETVQPEILFKNYVWVTGTSDGAKGYSAQFYKRLIAFSEKSKKFVVEIASNDGTFLKPFVKAGHKVLGVDPAENIVKEAILNGIPSKADFFGKSVAEEILDINGHADLIFARNVIPHVSNAKDVISGISTLLSDDGVGAIEFHRADIIMEGLHYDSIYHEHLYYHSIDSLNKLLEIYRLSIFDIDESPISGGSFVIYFSKNSKNKTDRLLSAIKRENDINLKSESTWLEFASRTLNHKNKLVEIINNVKNQGKTIAGYGASARSSTLLNYCNLSYKDIPFIMDKATLKQGFYTPGSSIKICSPEEGINKKPDCILLLAWNFKNEIINELQNKYKWSGQVILPLPNSPKIIEI